MPSQTFIMPSTLHIGEQAADQIGREATRLQTAKALIVSDDPVVAAGCVDPIIQSLEISGIDYEVYTGVDKEPNLHHVEEGLDVIHDKGCDLVVTVGGGSAHDCGKAIGIAATHEGDLYENYAGIERLTNELPPITSVNTTAGTGSEVTRHCVLTNMDRKLNSHRLKPVVV
nr:iron-containing alcohol dehydrogenase [Desulfovibrio inopinatus]